MATAALPVRSQRRNTAWMRVRLGELEQAILRAEAYGDRPLTSAEIRARLAAIREGRER